MYAPRMRRAISFVLASILFLVGAYALWVLLFRAPYLRGWMTMGAALMLTLGGY
jgi:hypothetical protein